MRRDEEVCWCLRTKMMMTEEKERRGIGGVKLGQKKVRIEGEGDEVLLVVS